MRNSDPQNIKTTPVRGSHGTGSPVDPSLAFGASGSTRCTPGLATRAAARVKATTSTPAPWWSAGVAIDAGKKLPGGYRPGSPARRALAVTDAPGKDRWRPSRPPAAPGPAVPVASGAA